MSLYADNLRIFSLSFDQSFRCIQIFMTTKEYTLPLWLHHLPCLSAPFNTDFSSSNIANMGGLHLTFSFLYHCLLWYAYSKHYFRFNGMFHVVAIAMVMEIFCSLQTIGILHYCLFIWRHTTATMVLWPMPVLFLWYTT